EAYGLDPDPGMTEAFDFHELSPGSFDLGPFSVRVDWVNHPVEAFGIRLEHGGATLTYSGDTGTSDALADLPENTDLSLCEAAFHDHLEHPKDMHLTGSEAGEHATRARARSLLLTHLVPWNDDDLTLGKPEAPIPDPSESPAVARSTRSADREFRNHRSTRSPTDIRSCPWLDLTDVFRPKSAP